MPVVSRGKPEFRVDDKVAFTHGTRRVKGFIVEDRGPLGVGGRRIYGVRLDMDPYDPVFLELPEDALELSPEPETPLSKEEISDYLARGGLLLMLHSGPDDSAPRVWLRRDNLGNVTHTFVAKRGLVGGAVPPGFAFHDGKVFSGKRQDVRRFINSFGLTDAEADTVIDHIGTRP